jgi:PAS domain S-box-containing protein
MSGILNTEAVLEQQLEETKQRLALVASVANAIVSPDPIERQLSNLVALTRGFLGCDACVIRICEGQNLLLAAHAGFPDDYLSQVLPANYGLAGQIISAQRAIAVEDVEGALANLPNFGPNYSFKSYAGAPMIANGRIVGLLGIYWGQEVQCVSKNDLEHLQTVANYGAIALENARLQTRAQSERDDRMRAELALSQAEQIYRDVISALGGVPYRRKFGEPGYEYLGDAIESLTGYTKLEMTQKQFAESVEEMTPIGHAANLQPEERRRLARLGEIRQWRADYLFKRKDGRRIWLSDASVPWFGEDRKVVGTLGILRDVSLRKQTEVQLRERERRLSIILDSIPESVLVLSREGTISDISAAAVKMLGGHSPVELEGRKILDFVAAHDREAFQQFLDNLSAQRQDAVSFDMMTTTAEARIAEFQGVPIGRYIGAESGKLLVGRDVTDLHELELQRRQSQRMEAVGLLAGGVAHDFNNILTGILGLTELAITAVPGQTSLASDLKEVRRLGERGADLTRQLLSFSRHSASNPTPVNLNSIIRDTQKLLKTLLGERIELNILIDSQLSNIKAEPAQMEQVIMNLAVNARDAMPSGGRITIRTQHVIPTDDMLRRRLVAPAECYALLSLTDTGEGMTEEVRERIFEPFFTTKQPGRGTGFGLATVYGIARQCGGDIIVTSQLGEGTTFELLFPCVTDAVPVQQRTSSQAGQYLNGTETILVAEDEKTVRDLITRVCRARGYEVYEARDGAEALQLYHDVGGKVDIVVSDVIMPAMGGNELANALRAQNPALKFLFISGYTDQEFTLPEIGDKRTLFIQKPFSPAILAVKIRDLLDENEE